MIISLGLLDDMNSVRRLFVVYVFVSGIVVFASAKTHGRRRSSLRVLSSADKKQWTEPSLCSRTCGGGVTLRQRICSQTNDSLCKSERKYSLCNVQDCPDGSEDFRNVQCQQFDTVEFEGEHHEWIAYYGAKNQCALNCLAKGQQFYRQLAERVIDGTPCDRNTLNVCIDGTCQLVGCDRVLGSERVHDACLVCGGHGTTCQTLSGTVETQDMKSGYNQLLILPQGSTSITIKEEGTSKNYFAVRNMNGIYYLNGNFEIRAAEPQYLGSTFFEYRRLHYGMEYLSTLGPLQEALIIEIVKQPGNFSPSVEYDCSVPYNASSDEKYAWTAQAWSQCNSSCGNGHMNRVVSCINLTYKNTVDAVFCRDMQKPSSQQVCCHHIKCTAKWYVGDWESCSLTCGRSGKQVRQVLCHGAHQGGHEEVLDDDHCPQPKPEVIRDCNHDVPCAERNAEWTVGRWSQCSASCGGGRRRRELFCFIGNELVDLQNCDESNRPDDSEDCNQMACYEDNSLQSDFASNGVPLGLCIDTEYGCCPDGVTAAGGPFQYGCNIPNCQETQYGCCSNGETSAAGPNGKGCAENGNDLPPDCYESVFGCCADGVTARMGIDGKGCGRKAKYFDDESSGSGFIAECELSLYGCCPNSRTPAEGPSHQGCHGTLKERVGGVNDLGKADQVVITELASSSSESRIPSTSSFQYSVNPSTVPGVPPHHGAIKSLTDRNPVMSTSHPGPIASTSLERLLRGNRHVVDCHSSVHGCCSDGKTPAAGPDENGCPIEEDHHKANADSCEFTTYGCCPDGLTPALGPGDAHCPHLLRNAVTCTLAKDPGPCSNYSLKWYFDSTYGNCISFEYGGCRGNDNRFETRNACRKSCINPEGIERCYLPQSPGRCYRALIRYYYSPQAKKCEEFVYGGCLGNENRFSVERDCEKFCIEPQKPDVCNQPPQTGRCRAFQQNYFFDHKEGLCRQFMYGGCGGNDNRFESLEACDKRCGESLVQGCLLPLDHGPCNAEFYQWHFNSETGRCEEFRYGGCLGNANRFRTKMDCEKSCKRLLQRTDVDKCTLSPDSGPCRGFFQRWFYNKTDGYCQEFVYGGCIGNDNRFESEPDCRTACDANHPIDVCTLPAQTGQCNESIERYYFDSETNECLVFVYGGCDGNGNNFQSLEECQMKCHSHITLTLSPESNRCLLPRDPGFCVESMLRWHYSPLDRRCVRFDYGGCGGNQNRFFSKSVCDDHCGHLALMTSTPDVTTQLPPGLDTSGHNAQHRVFSTGFPEDGLVVLTSPNPVDDWEDEGKAFTWHDQDVESLFSPTTDAHVKDNSVLSIQPGSDSEWSQFTESALSEHHRHTTLTSLETIFASTFVDDPLIPGQKEEPPTDYEGSGMKEESSGEMTVFPFASVAGDFLFSQTSAAGDEGNPCQLPKDTGPCKAYFPSYYFDRERSACLVFVWGGCGGTANRFATAEECEQKCLPGKSSRTSMLPSAAAEVSTLSAMLTALDTAALQDTRPGLRHWDVCKMHKEQGPCEDFQVFWYFEPVGRHCRRFYYGGCEGNDNRYNSSKECYSRCLDFESGVSVPVTPQEITATILDVEPVFTVSALNATSFDPDVAKDESVVSRCELPQDSGQNCTGSQEFWYHDPELSVCRPFNYSGCGGNENRFVTEEECVAICLEPTVETPSITSECYKSVFHCCPDGITPARDWNFRGCPEEVPIIHFYPEVIPVFEHSDVFLDCVARGAPRPQVTWYQDGIPILHNELRVRKTTVLANDTLHITNIEVSDTKVSYSCRASNSIGADTHTYKLIINVPVKIENEGEMEIIEIVRRSSVQLTCSASGVPVPSITWTKDGEPVFSDMNHRITDKSLLISGVNLTDAGNYVCHADNGIGATKEKLYQIHVLNLLSVQIITERTNITAGVNVKLQCRVSENPRDVNITWLLNGKPLDSQLRFQVFTSGELLIKSIKPGDGGEYVCSATRWQETTSASVFLNIHARKLPEVCVDKPWYANCQLIVEADLCQHAYFSVFCCSTCHKAGHL